MAIAQRPSPPASPMSPHRRRRPRRGLLAAAAAALAVAVTAVQVSTPDRAEPAAASPAPEPASGAARQAPVRVTLSVTPRRVAPSQHAIATTTVTSHRQRVSGPVRVKVRGHARVWTVRGRARHGRLTLPLPRLRTPGRYRVRAQFAGTATLAPGRSTAVPLRVSRPDVPPKGYPRAGNTGVPRGVDLTSYRGPCTITRNRTVIDSKRVGCDLTIQAKGVVIKSSSLKRVWMDQDVMHAQGQTGWSFSLTDSTVDAGTYDGPGVCCGNYTLLRVEMRGGHNGAQCENGASYCNLTDSWIHKQYEPRGGTRHLGGFLNDGGTPTNLIHNSITCDPRAENDEGGCTGDINLIPNFGPMKHVTVRGNYLGANANNAFCTYAGARPGDAGYARQSNYIVYKDNLFERRDVISNPAPGQPSRTSICGAYGPVTGFAVGRTGNVWSGNRYDDGTPIRCDAAHRCD